ncbi:hypothetical protein SAMN04487765_2983 [Tenacibaculum sp. MAR_2010_89]|nr:hypothetical protein SAMN04487765_2983 [Tenacibaculum sp. MAR_2010_89]
MKLKINQPIVEVEWLQNNFTAENLIILDATIKKVTTKNKMIDQKKTDCKCCFF